MEELAQKLKAEMIRSLRRNPQNLHRDFMIWRAPGGVVRWTYEETAQNIEDETYDGIYILTGLIQMAAEIMKRENDKKDILDEYIRGSIKEIQPDADCSPNS